MKRWRFGKATRQGNETPPVAVNTPSGVVTSYQVGDAMRRVREAGAISMAEMARRTHLRETTLTILEAGDFAKLPGPTFVVGFLKLCAQNLGDAELDRLIFHFINQLVGQDNPLYFASPTVISRNRPGIRLVLGALLMFVVLFVAYEYYFAEIINQYGRGGTGDQQGRGAIGSGGLNPKEMPPTNAAAQALAVGQGGDTGRQPPSRADADGVLGRGGAPLDPNGKFKNDPGKKDPGKTDSTTRSGAASSDGTSGVGAIIPNVVVTEPIPPPPKVVILVADKSTWLQILDKDGKVVQSKTLQVGEKLPIPEGGQYFLNTGNAGGLHPRVDGRDLPLLGKTGQVVRKVDLNPEALINRKPD